MGKNYANKNLQDISFNGEDLIYADFSGSDLRGTNFTGANLSGANFAQSRTGITPTNTALIFFFALIVSLLSGYVAMMAGQSIQVLLKSEDYHLRVAGIIALVVILLFIAYAYWKGVGKAIKHLMIPAAIVALVTGTLAYLSNLGTGQGMFYVILSYLLVVIMFVIGTIARAAAGSLSSILFVIVALGGGMFGRSVGGGIGTLIMAISCALISKRALSGAKGFEVLRKIATYITRRFGTSFRSCKLVDADFSKMKSIRNCDFSNADVAMTKWGDSKKINCIS